MGHQVLYTSSNSTYIPEIIPVPVASPLRAFYTGAAISANGNTMVVCAQRTVASPTVGPVYISFDFGASWAEITTSGTGARRRWNDVDISADGSTVYCAEKASSGLSHIYKYIVSTGIWSEHVSTPYGFNDISCSSNGQYVSAVENIQGRILVSADFGSTWTTVSFTGYNGECKDVCMNDTGQFQLITTYGTTLTNGTAFLSSNYGVSFSRIIGITQGINDSAISSDGSKISLAFVNRNQMAMIDNGVIKLYSLPESKNWTALAMSSDSTFQILAGVDSKFYTYTKKTDTWAMISDKVKVWNDIALSANGRKRLAVTFSEPSPEPGFIYTFNV